jgi:hypothetical protein
MKDSKYKFEQIKRKAEIGYTPTIYGSVAAAIEQMRLDIDSLIEINQEIISIKTDEISAKIKPTIIIQDRVKKKTLIDKLFPKRVTLEDLESLNTGDYLLFAAYVILSLGCICVAGFIIIYSL